MSANKTDALRQARFGTPLSRRAAVALLGGGALLSARRAFADEGEPAAWQTVEQAVREGAERLAPRAAVAGLTLEQKVAQLMVVKPEAVQGYGTVLSVEDELRQLLLTHPVGGVILKDANFVDPDQVRNLTAGLQACSQEVCGLPMLVGVDEEGGTVVRVSDKAAFGVADPGNMRAVGDYGSVEFAESEAYRVGSYLRDLGVNLDFAPDADITGSEDSFVYWRSFGSDPQLVADMVAAQVRGFNAAGTLCSPKHFPGIGDAKGDSHVQSINLDKSLDELWAHELVPFEAAVREQAPLIMVGHMTCTSIDAQMPASCSHAVVTDLLRGQLGYDGVVITDSLGMAAVNELFAPYDLGVICLEAGCDLLLSPADWWACMNGIVDAVHSGRLSEERIDQSIERIVRMKWLLG